MDDVSRKISDLAMESRKIIGLQTISVERQYRINDAKDEDEACCEGILEV